MSIAREREVAFAVAEQSMRRTRLANAIIRDTFLTPAEQAARMNAYVECLDREETP